MRYGARQDSNARQVVEMFRALGCSVEHVVPRRAGVPDLLVGHQGRTHLVEVKAPKGKVRPTQHDWAQAWRGERPWVVRSIEEARAVVATWHVLWAPAASQPEFDADDYNGRPPRVVVHGGLIQRREARVTPKAAALSGVSRQAVDFATKPRVAKLREAFAHEV